MQKQVKSRKEHKCDECEGVIHSNETYELWEHRTPRFDADDNQIGVDFLRYKSCAKCVEKRERECAEIDALMQTEEYKYLKSMQEHIYP